MHARDWADDGMRVNWRVGWWGARRRLYRFKFGSPSRVSIVNTKSLLRVSGIGGILLSSVLTLKFVLDHVRSGERWSRSGNSANRECRGERIHQHRAKNQVSVERAGIIRPLDESRGRAKEREREAEKEEKSKEGQMRSTHTHTRAHTASRCNYCVRIANCARCRGLCAPAVLMQRAPSRPRLYVLCDWLKISDSR